MANSIDILLNRDSMITGLEWQRKISEFEFPVSIDTDFDPFEFSGLLPCKFRNRKTSFIYFHGPSTELEWIDDPPFGFGDRDFFVSLEIRGGQYSHLVAAVCASVLAHETDGVIYDAEGKAVIYGSESIAWAREIIVGLEEDIRNSKAAKMRVKEMSKSKDSIRTALLEEVQKFVGAKSYRGTAYLSTLYINFDGLRGKRALKISGWVLSKNGEKVMAAEELEALKNKSESAYKRFIEQFLAENADGEIASMSVSDGNVLRVCFANGFQFEVDPSWNRAYMIWSEWALKIGRIELHASDPIDISVRSF